MVQRAAPGKPRAPERVQLPGVGCLIKQVLERNMWCRGTAPGKPRARMDAASGLVTGTSATGAVTGGDPTGAGGGASEMSPGLLHGRL